MMPRFASLLICAIFLFSVVGCQIDLTEQGQKDRALAEKVTERLKTRKSVFGEYFKEVKFDRKTRGNYNFNFLKTDLNAQQVFDYTLRLLAMTADINDTVVMTGRSFISLTGYMGNEKVVYGTYSGGGGVINPFQITLEGRYAGAEFNENYNVRGGSMGGGLSR